MFIKFLWVNNFQSRINNFFDVFIADTQPVDPENTQFQLSSEQTIGNFPLMGNLVHYQRFLILVSWSDLWE